MKKEHEENCTSYEEEMFCIVVEPPIAIWLRTVYVTEE